MNVFLFKVLEVKFYIHCKVDDFDFHAGAGCNDFRFRGSGKKPKNRYGRN